MCAIPVSWKLEIRKFSKWLPVVKSQNIERLFIGTNVLLMKMGIKDRDECFFCESKPETIEHL